MIPKRNYGQTGLEVSALGLGAGQIGDARIDETTVARLLNQALDLGITLIDTARGYGLSEARIGKHLKARRKEFVLSTKVGYGIPGFEDWTADCITAGIDTALGLLQTDRLDIVHLHSCPRSTLEQGDVIAALETAKQAGKIRAIAYSGENDDLDYAIRCGRFDGFMASLNLCDQQLIDTMLPRIAHSGFIAKRASANHPWRFAQRPAGDYCETYWERFQTMALPPDTQEWGEIALRFSAWWQGISSAIIGTANPENLAQNVKWFEQGALPEQKIHALRAAFVHHGTDWRGQI